MNLKHHVIAFVIFLAGLSFARAEEKAATAPKLDPVDITKTLKRAADWQLAHPNKTEIRFWPIAPFYDGLIDLSEVTGDPKYLAAVVGLGIQAGWTAGPAVYFADEHAVGHAWLDIYLMQPDRKERFEPFRKRFDEILAKPVTEKLSMSRKPVTPGVENDFRWTWCDALFMGPPTWARLAKATGDKRYLEFMDAEFKESYDALWDPEENLFYRDETFIGKKSANGKKIFWARGDGWVFAGLPLVLDVLPNDWTTYKFYTELFQKMAPAVLAAQQPDGFWYPSLLDPQEIPIGETSGSAFYVYGLAWGVNQGLLDRQKYWPAVEKGWKAICARIGDDGHVGYVQPIGVAPGKFQSSSTQLYGTGAVLMAGSEILQTLGVTTLVEPTALLAAAEKLVAQDQSPRAYARLLPERKDDLAWENDKVAYRLYGPALRDGPEASGIDAWAKKVAHPIINNWYADEVAGKHSYHKDHGEGYDGYKVGDSLGCGGTALWHSEKLVIADVYDRVQILYTTPDVVEIEAFYTYPAIDGTVYFERRRIKLSKGSHLNEITCRFSLDPRARKPVAGLEVAIGLAAQTNNAKHTLAPERGVMAVWDSLQPGGEPFGIGAVVPPGAKMLQQTHTGTDPKADQALAILRTDAKGEIRYRAGFVWPAGGTIANEEIWLRYLKDARRASAP